MNTLLSSTLQRIGKQLIAAEDAAMVEIDPIDAQYLQHVLGRYLASGNELPFLCVLYAQATCAEELGLPPGPLPAFVFLTWAYGKNAYAMNDVARHERYNSVIDVVGYSRTIAYVPESIHERSSFFNVIGPKREFLDEIRTIDEGGVNKSFREENVEVRFANEPPMDESAEATRVESDADDDPTSEPPPLDPDDCPVCIICDDRDDFRESEYRQFKPIIDDMSIDELEEFIKFVDTLWGGPLGTKEGRMMVRNHPLLKFSHHDKGIVTSRLYELQNLISHEIRFRRAEPYEFIADDSQSAEPYAHFGRGLRVDMHRLTYENFNALPKLGPQDFLDVRQRLLDADKSLTDLMTREAQTLFDMVLGVLELTPRHYVVLCSAFYHSIYGPKVDGIIQPPTARTILRDVFKQSELHSHLKLLWDVTLNGILVRAEPSVPLVTLADAEHDPLDDHYVVSDAFLNMVDDYENRFQDRICPLPVKYRTTCDMQIGYDAALRRPVRISMPHELLTSQEWGDLMSTLNTYEPSELLPMIEELQQIWRIYRLTKHMPDDLGEHHIYGRACVNGAILPFRLYVIMNTILYTYYRRSYNRWYYYRPDEEFL
ncbi:MAG: hypothetical protein FGM32_10815 [Candidatus Kapabacteria bacterium]|nr:hypothetical protein [Candidatus Kapabacteria bacterium]